MNYSRPELLDGLAQRYTIGTLRGPARQRFSRVINELPAAQKAVENWESLLAPLAWSLQSVQPSELVWHRISRNINKQENKSQPSTSRTAWFASAAMGAFALFSLAGWWNALQQPPETIYQTVIQTVPEAPDVAVINSAEVTPIWTARVYTKSARLDINVQNNPTVESGKDYELWALTGDGTPVSLGLLPKNNKASLELSADQLNALSTTNTLAVSLEPTGGSPELVPTGPVLYTAAMLMDQ